MQWLLLNHLRAVIIHTCVPNLPQCFLAIQHLYVYMWSPWEIYVPVDPDVGFESPIPCLISNCMYLSQRIWRNNVVACCLMWRDLRQSLCWGLKNLCQQKKIVQCLLPVLKGARKECLGCLIVSHYSDGRLDQSLCLWDHYSVILILGLLPDRVFPPDMCNISHLQNSGYIIMFRRSHLVRSVHFQQVTWFIFVWLRWYPMRAFDESVV